MQQAGEIRKMFRHLMSIYISSEIEIKERKMINVVN